MSAESNHSQGPSEMSLPPTKEELAATRAEVVFAPYTSPKETDHIPSEGYDYLFDDSYTPPEDVESAARRAENRRGTVSELSQEYSMNILARFENEAGLDSKVKEIISQYNGGNRLASEDTMRMLRENKQARIELGLHFLSKLENLKSALPDRVAANTEKRSTMPGYSEIPGLRSREYASLLALAHLDGTFDPAKSHSEKIVYDQNGNVEIGQHRTASEMLLFW